MNHFAILMNIRRSFPADGRALVLPAAHPPAMTATTRPATMKELKVRIPMSHHHRLHLEKVLAGRSIAASVTEALDMYFRAQRPQG